MPQKAAKKKDLKKKENLGGIGFQTLWIENDDDNTNSIVVFFAYFLILNNQLSFK